MPGAFGMGGNTAFTGDFFLSFWVHGREPLSQLLGRHAFAPF
jgi:hypothetical protein